MNMQQIPRRRPGDRIIRIPLVKAFRVPLPIIPKPKRPGVSTIILAYGFAGVIALGTLLLTLPFATKSGDVASPLNALFTATSAVCVTGLVVVDTGTYWSHFGQAVILLLIQIGGLGFMTSATLFFLLLGRRIGVKERFLIGRSVGLEKPGGMVKLVIRIAIFTIVLEIIGATVLYFLFSTQESSDTAGWWAVFHAISAFNNAGFDIFGNFRSLSAYETNPGVLLTIAALIILGGISFIVIMDVISVRRFIRLALDSKIVIITTVSLLIIGAIVILVSEYSNANTLEALSWPDRLLNSFFHSVTPRTAGFSTMNMGSMADYSLFFTIFLMFVGGAAGSTAGGIKVNTFGMLTATIWSTIRGNRHPGVFGREFVGQQINQALSLVLLSLMLVSVVVLILTITEEADFIQLLFETVSAFGTVGLSTGITPDLSIAGKFIITAMMFIGRLGPLVLALSLAQREQPSAYRYPEDEVRIG